jgi:hypothetical protein
MIPSWYPPGIVGEKKLNTNFYAVTDGSFMEIWDSIGSYIGVPFFCKAPVLGFYPTPYLLPQFQTFLWQKRERERERESSSKENNQ